METVEAIVKGRYRAVIARRNDGLFQVSLLCWLDPDEHMREGAWTVLCTAESKTDTLEIARTLAQSLLAERGS
jgi:hypothetical protein